MQIGSEKLLVYAPSLDEIFYVQYTRAQYSI